MPGGVRPQRARHRGSRGSGPPTAEPATDPAPAATPDPAAGGEIQAPATGDEPTAPTSTEPAAATPASDTGTTVPATDPVATTGTGTGPGEPAPSTTAPATGTRSTGTTTSTATPATTTSTKPGAAAPKPSRAQEATIRLRAAKEARAANPDARFFREHFVPKGRIPEQPLLPAARADLLRSAVAGTGTDWSLLTSVAWIKSRWGDPSAGSLVGGRLTDAAWRAYGTDGDGDGIVSRASAADQAKTVAVYLDEARPTTSAALRAYFSNTRRPVVARTALFLADYYDAMGEDALVKGLSDEDVQEALATRTLDDADLDIYPGGRSDIEAGLVDPRILVTLSFLANRFGSATVTSMVSGHGVYTAGGNISLHSFGQAMDIGSLGGENVTGHMGPGSRTHRAVKELLLLPESMQPAEVISLWDLGGASFALADHADHIHVGFERS